MDGHSFDYAFEHNVYVSSYIIDWGVSLKKMKDFITISNWIQFLLFYFTEELIVKWLNFISR